MAPTSSAVPGSTLHVAVCVLDDAQCLMSCVKPQDTNERVSFYHKMLSKTNGNVRGQNTSDASEMAASICLQTSMTGLLRSSRGSGIATPWTADAAAAKNKGVTTFKSIGPAKEGSKPRG